MFSSRNSPCKPNIETWTKRKAHANLMTNLIERYLNEKSVEAFDQDNPQQENLSKFKTEIVNSVLEELGSTRRSSSSSSTNSSTLRQYF